MSPPAAEPDKPDPRVWTIAGACMLGPLMSGLDSTMVNVALNAIGRSFDAPLATVQWVTTGYLLALALALPLTGWLVDRVGARRIFLGCFAAFVVCSALCAMATSAGMLIACRLAQGVAGGLLAPLMQMMMARHAGRHMARVIGIAAMVPVTGQMLGPSLGGLILTFLDWRWVFVVNVPIGIVAIAFAARVLPKDEGVVARRLDILGLALVSPGLALLLEGFVSLASGGLIAPMSLVLSALLLACYVRHWRRSPGVALIDLGLFHGAVFRASAATQFLSHAVNFGGQLLLPLYFLEARGLTPAETGLMLAPMGLGFFLALPTMSRLSERLGARAISGAGAAFAFAGTLPFALAGPDTPLVLLALALVVRGFGVGSITIPSASAAYASVPRDKLGHAATALNICQRFGGPAGTASLAICLQLALSRVALPAAAYAIALWMLAGLAAAAFVAAMRLPGRPGRA